MKTKLTKRQKKIVSKAASQAWQKWLNSKGIRLLMLDPQKSGKGVSMIFEYSVPLTSGMVTLRRSIRRTLSSSKPTPVPAVLADKFLNHPVVIEVTKQEKQPK